MWYLSARQRDAPNALAFRHPVKIKDMPGIQKDKKLNRGNRTCLPEHKVA